MTERTNTITNTFPKAERLHSKRRIEQLFQDGGKGFVYPFRYFIYAEERPEREVSLLISVPKKIYKKATDRNHLKRRTREAYRTNKSTFRDAYLNNGQDVSLALIYTADEKLAFPDIEKSIRKILNKLSGTE